MYRCGRWVALTSVLTVMLDIVIRYSCQNAAISGWNTPEQVHVEYSISYKNDITYFKVTNEGLWNFWELVLAFVVHFCQNSHALWCWVQDVVSGVWAHTPESRQVDDGELQQLPISTTRRHSKGSMWSLRPTLYSLLLCICHILVCILSMASNLYTIVECKVLPEP